MHTDSPNLKPRFFLTFNSVTLMLSWFCVFRYETACYVNHYVLLIFDFHIFQLKCYMHIDDI